MNPQITIKNLKKVYPTSGLLLDGAIMGGSYVQKESDKVAVKDVNLTIKEGDRLGIVGRNGAGKSTLLHMIAGLSSPTSGEIVVEGKVTSIMTLGLGLRDDLSGRENIYIDGEMQGKNRDHIDPMIEEVISFADLGEFIDYPVRTYSTGMKARLAFAMIAFIEPEILIIDEALAVGDASFATKATTRIKEICAKGKIVIIVSHGMESIKAICNRCLWMDSGSVVMDGSPDEVTKAYIEAVRSEDEIALLDKFRRYVGKHIYVHGFDFTDVSFIDSVSGQSKLLLESGENYFLRLKGNVASVSNVIINVKLIRIDDTLFFEETFSIEDFVFNQQFFGIEIEFSPIILGSGIYRLDVSINQESKCVAQSLSIFEVYVLNPPSGGKPMLITPVMISLTTN